MVAANKMDLILHSDQQSYDLDSPSIQHSDLPTYLRQCVNVEDVHCISCHHNEGIDKLVASLEKNLRLHFEYRSGNGNDQELNQDDALVNEPSFITRERHRQHLSACQEMLDSATLHLENGVGTLELAAEDLRLAAVCIGRIGGKIDPEEILDKIFLEFCIGK